jgi:hypothetical protein
MDFKDLLCLKVSRQSLFAKILSHGVTLSCAGLSIQIPGLQDTVWDLFGLASTRSGPTRVIMIMDCKDLLRLTVPRQSLFQKIPIAVV